jgi:hypothetical protein
MRPSTWRSSAIRCCTQIERFLKFLNRAVKRDGLVVGLDYFGPPRLQVTYEVKRLFDEIFESFPEHLRFNLQTREVEPAFVVDTIEAVERADPSEAPRSSDLRSPPVLVLSGARGFAHGRYPAASRRAIAAS